jgi:hypothetical protein
LSQSGQGDFGTVLAAAALVANVDTPAPGPADLVALGILGIGGLAVLQESSGVDTRPDDPFERIAFGQKRISPTFSDGLTISASAAMIVVGAQPSLEVTRTPQGQLAAINNRTLAAYGIAGRRPTNLIFRPFDLLTPRERGRFSEPGVPSFIIPVTRGNEVLFFVEAPR